MTIAVPSTNFPWSPDTNYPAGVDPWSGQPTKVDPVDDKFTPGRSIPATYLNKLLAERDATIAALVSAANPTPKVVNFGNITGQATLHTWPADSIFEVSQQYGLVAIGGSDTPFTSGVAAGDVIQLDFSIGLLLQSTDPAQGYVARLMVSETATNFTSGTWAPVAASTHAQRNFLPDVNQYAVASWSAYYTAAGTTGHVRFALAVYTPPDPSGLADNSGSHGGRYTWYRPN